MEELNVRVISELAGLLVRGGEDAKEAARRLWNLSLEGPETRAAALCFGAVLALLPYLRPDTTPELLKILIQTFSNLCRHADDEPAVELELVSPALPLVKVLLYKGDEHVLEAACVAVTNIMHGTTEGIEAVQAVPGLTARLVALMGHKAAKVRRAALGAMANMLAGTGTQVDRCLNLKCIDSIASLLRNSKAFGELAARAIGNVFTHTHFIQCALEMDVLTPLKNILANGEAECQMQAAAAISNLCFYGTAAQRDRLVSSGVLEPYCALLAASDSTLELLVVAGLQTLLLATEKDDTDSEINEHKLKPLCLKLSEAGIIHPMQQLQSQAINEDLRRQAHELSITICFYERGEDLIYEDGKVFTPAEIVEVMTYNPRAMHTRAARAARRMLSRARGDGPARLQSVSDIMVKAKILEPLKAALYEAESYNCSDLELEAVWALANITFAKEHIITAVLEVGVVVRFVTYLSKKGEVALRAAIALRNIASHAAKARDAVLEAGAVQALLPLLRKETPLRDLRTYVWTYQRFCCPHDSPESAARELVLPALPSISELLGVADQRVLEAACVAVTNVMHGPNERTEAVQAVPGLTARLVALLGHEAAEVRKAALAAVVNMLNGTNTQADRCLDVNCLEPIASLLRSTDPSIAELAARASCIIFVHTQSIQRALDMDILTPLRDMLANGDTECRKQAVKTISNLCFYGTAAQRDQLVSSGVLEPYCALLAAPDGTLAALVVAGLHALLLAAEKDDTDSEINEHKLKSLCLKLSEAGIIDLIQQLQSQVIDESLQRQAQEMSTTICFYARGEDLIFEDRKVLTPADIAEDLKSQNLVMQTRAKRLAHRMLQDSPLETIKRLKSFTDIIKAGLLALMEDFKKDDCPDIQIEAVRTVARIANLKEHIMAVIEVGAIPELVTLVSKKGEVAVEAANALGFISLHGTKQRQAVLGQGAVQALLPHLRLETPLEDLRVYVWCYAQCCRFRDDEELVTFELLSPALPRISELLCVADKNVLVKACNALANLMHGKDWLIDVTHIEAIQAVPGLTARLVALLGHEDAKVQEAALIAVGDMVDGNHTQVLRCLDAGCLDHIVLLLQCNKPYVIYAAIDAICNISEHKDLIEWVLQTDILSLLRDILANGEPKNQRAAATVIYNVCYRGSVAQCTKLVSSGALEPYFALLAASDHSTVIWALRGLKCLLLSTREGKLDAAALRLLLRKYFGDDGLIMTLSNHENTEIQWLASEILKLYPF